MLAATAKCSRSSRWVEGLLALGGYGQGFGMAGLPPASPGVPQANPWAMPAPPPQQQQQAPPGGDFLAMLAAQTMQFSQERR